MASSRMVSHYKDYLYSICKSEDLSEATRLLEACQTHGFFYLGLQDFPEGETLLAEANQLQSLAQSAFSLPLPEKLRYSLKKGISLFGYKPAGTIKQTDPSHRPDRTEFFNISKDYLHYGTALSPFPSSSSPSLPTSTTTPYPPVIESSKSLLKSFTKHSHDVGMIILQTLARQLNLPNDQEFTNLNRFDQPSGDHCRLIKTSGSPQASSSNSEKSIGLPSHTDFGSVTILFNWLGGLQIESSSPTEEEFKWQWVKPIPNHAIINFGDAMVTFTNGALKSAKHRVVPLPGEQATRDRHSVVYFVRPHNDVPMKPVAGFDTGGDRVKAAGKFSPVAAPGKEQQQQQQQGKTPVLTAGEWMVKRAIQLGN
ncbi:hypothetical protein QBC35DRAFT_458931 [Podospora australis]|uniref:Fe2OG dioxygenase domain-containing protein n=1 Tax=Podospora australis TaxID=1536484 RepID=A0AAN6X7B9_9PEZI|nr:hypothetical protein QBC35DRAFT_458931 [Podospora australis]